MAEKIGFIGLGRMGLPIALTLAKAGFEVSAFDISPRDEAVRELQEAHGTVVSDLAGVVAGSGVVITNLPDSAAVEAVLRSQEVLSNLQSGMTWLEMSSGFPADTQRFADLLASQYGMEMVDAPICNGGVPAAYEGQLTLCVGGSDAGVERVRPLLDAVSSRALHVGPVGAGHTMKLLSNYIKLGVCGLMSEAYTVAAQSGFKFDDLVAALQHCVAAKFVSLEDVGHEFFSEPPPGPPYFRLALARKDLRYFAAHAATSGVFTPMADGAHELYLVAEANGFADVGDVQGVWRASQHMASGPHEPPDSGRVSP